MSTSFNSIIDSTIFKFVVGPHKKEYNIHGAALSRVSRPLDVLLNGEMREAEEKRVDWSDVEEKTFLRLVQWAYTKGYGTEEPEIDLDDLSIENPSSRQGDTEQQHHLLTRPANIKKNGLIKKFLDENVIVKYRTPTSIFTPRINIKSCENYTKVFLCHAQLYVLGDKYDIPSLRKLALHRLHATLKCFTLYPSRFDDIATLAKYVFENTVPDDKIRTMITHYYACIVEDASKHDGLESLIDENPDFAFGLISRMNERLD
ncbi:hypothetical protein VPNG_07196 [Cytospora leucostoma]|uniref:BTB domain-containing protein n=1 Tax=Cytospora leucostoma TaxID=1230097 RepID=A0A423WKA2_9PEZI|nr:hypothetical protein VPNG_07196 [Cytospora leucostoma]